MAQTRVKETQTWDVSASISANTKIGMIFEQNFQLKRKLT